MRGIDLDSGTDEVLEIGTGRIDRIFVLMPDDAGDFHVATGGVYSYYEFPQPTAERLTDEQWWEMLRTRRGARPPSLAGAALPVDSRESISGQAGRPSATRGSGRSRGRTRPAWRHARWRVRRGARPHEVAGRAKRLQELAQDCRRGGHRDG